MEVSHLPDSSLDRPGMDQSYTCTVCQEQQPRDKAQFVFMDPDHFVQHLLVHLVKVCDIIYEIIYKIKMRPLAISGAMYDVEYIFFIILLHNGRIFRSHFCSQFVQTYLNKLFYFTFFYESLIENFKKHP